MSTFHVDQIATRVVQDYATKYRRDELDDVNNLSRYLSLYATERILDGIAATPQRLIEVTDGGKDRGIDAVAVDPNARLIVFTQAKWRQNGQGSLAVDESLRFVDGVRSLVGMQSQGEPVHASPELRGALQTLLTTPSTRIRLVTASTGGSALAAEVAQPIETFLSEMNDLEGVEPVVTHTHYGQAELFNSLAVAAHENVDLDINLLDWGGTADPLRIYYGRVSGADIALWYKSHGDALFAENIRVVIPKSEINAGILETVREEPQHFSYYNNGITILAERIETAPGGQLNKAVGRMRLVRASIVNGAQTVSTLGSVLGTTAEPNLADTFVMTRCIEVPAADDELGRGITRYANTQNEVSSQDFAFLDEEQHRLAKELRVIGVDYVIRQAEKPSLKDAKMVIHVREAAVALACAAKDIGPAVIAKREVSRLFASSGGEYARLFNAATDPLTLSRSVKVLRYVDSLLDIARASASGVELGVVVHGRLVITHLVLKSIGAQSLRDPAFDVDEFLEQQIRPIRLMVAALVDSFPENSYPGNVFKNRTRCAELVKDAGLA
ncbi:AIPR family protein [Geodermatophilus sp. SYSU D00779]